jgi:hypothetical protein
VVALSNATFDIKSTAVPGTLEEIVGPPTGPAIPDPNTIELVLTGIVKVVIVDAVLVTLDPTEYGVTSV